MFTDIVGFTKLAQENESAALELLEVQRASLRPVFARHGGREVKTIGDAFLVEFESALEATLCAVEVQNTIHRMALEKGQDLKLRIGVHLGDVIHKENDILGDAVNVASRIEPLAEPGGVCISEQVYYHIKNKVDFALVSLGRRELKNVGDPVEVFKVVLPWMSRADPEGTLDRRRIAVLPFSNISPDKNDEYFAEGMTEELTNTISHNVQLKVIARTSAGRYKGTSKSISEIAREIGVGSILEGSVRKAGNKIRVTAQLIDAQTENHLWSDNYDRELDDIFTIQTEIAKNVSQALAAKLIQPETKAEEKKAPMSSKAYVRYLRGRTLLTGRTKEGMLEAKKLFEDAISEDPNYAEAYVGLADVCHLLSNYEYFPRSQMRPIGEKALEKALSLNDGLADAHNSLAEYLAEDYKFEESVKEFEKAILLNPNYALAHHWYGIILLEMGKEDEGDEQEAIAAELDPLSPALAGNIAYACMRRGDSEGAIKNLEKLKELDPGNKFHDFFQAIMSEYQGDFESAVRKTEAALRSNPENYGMLSSLAFYYGRLGNPEKAMEIIHTLEKLPEDSLGKANKIGIAYGGIPDLDAMFNYLDSAFEERSILWRVLRYSNFDESVRKDPRYAQLFQRAKLTV